MGRRKGFTLIELLVVIAIIAILAAILFPVFLTAKAKGQQASCAQNMKQIAVALQIYLGNYQDTYPMNRYRDPGMPAVGKMDGTRSNWKVSLQTCMKTKGDVWRCPGNFNRMLPDETGKAFQQTYASTAYPVSYALNGDYFNKKDGSFNLPLIKASGINRPSKLIFILESRFDAPDLESGMLNTGHGTWECTTKRGRGWINIHHGLVTNFVFADTHVQSMKVAASMTPVSYWDVNYGKQDDYNNLARILPPDCYK